ncbi:hypothetical protein [Metapseudomonas resinovorans]|uniref:Lipoprotein n=1 Tax=Metapseudomonas resinovorans NBRC 106553 TaxID=1245471 RepID=S6AG74_METRE|nr:hypothetical protein [Pseudomonas resinovorans]BAN49217.1 hypothetical protein PCA10_34850 [Pseudomonas resinovorans NBRC 106553]
MRKSLFFGALALQACAFAAVAGEWPAGGSEKFTKECVASAAGQVPQDRAIAYCQCSSGMMQKSFTSEQLEAVGKGTKPTEAEVSILVDISRTCARQTLQ